MWQALHPAPGTLLLKKQTVPALVELTSERERIKVNEATRLVSTWK